MVLELECLGGGCGGGYDSYTPVESALVLMVLTDKSNGVVLDPILVPFSDKLIGELCTGSGGFGFETGVLGRLCFVKSI